MPGTASADRTSQYTVRTEHVTWTATGTAFDLRLEADTTTGDAYVRGIGIEHAVAIGGPDLAGDPRRRLGRADPASPGPTDLAELTLGPIGTRGPARSVAARQRGAGCTARVRPGILDGRLAEASRAEPPRRRCRAPQPSAPAQSADPAGRADLGAGRRDPEAGDRPATPKPTPKPTPSPRRSRHRRPSRRSASLGLIGDLVPRRVHAARLVRRSGDTGFNHYQTIRSTAASIPAVYPPAAPAVAPDGLYVDGSRDDRRVRHRASTPVRRIATGRWPSPPTTRPYAASAVKTVTAKAAKALGALTLTPEPGGFTADWTAYPGPDACFGFYKLVVSADDPTPSYLEGSTAVWVGSIRVGRVDHRRVDWIRAPTTSACRPSSDTDDGKVLVAETDVADVVIP